MSIKPMTLAAAVGVCALALPASVAGAQGVPHGADYSSANATAGGSDDSSGSGGGAATGNAHRTPTELGQSTAGSPSALVVRRDGSRAEPFVAYVGDSAPAASGDGFDFDWASAGVGAGVAIAMIALAGTALITVRRHAAPSASASAG
jgi:hypothetical protein